MELIGPHHHRVGQPRASFLLSKLFLYQLLSTLHISVSAPAAKETQKSIKYTITFIKLYFRIKSLSNKKGL